LHLHIYIYIFTFTLTYIYTFEGTDNNETLKVFRSGGADPDGDRPGDLYVTIKVKTLISS
jgi:DnaJ-class molecular chaperone